MCGILRTRYSNASPDHRAQLTVERMTGEPDKEKRISLRTGRISGIVTCISGIVMIGFAVFGLLFVVLQRLMFSTMSLVDMVDAIHAVWLVYLPLMIVGGIVYAVTGWKIQGGSHFARRVAQANSTRRS